MRTFAPVGDTPILRENLTRDHLSAISAITLDGKLFFNVQDDAFKGPDVVKFLRHLLRCIPGKLCVIWDGNPIHRAQVVKDFLATRAGRRVHLERLPGYAPELNPDEYVWTHLKHVEMKNLCCRDIEHLRIELRNGVKRLREKPHIVRGFKDGVGL